MKQKIFKPFLLQMIGLFITQCVMLNYNPLSVAWFGAMTTMKRYYIISLPVMLTGLYYAMGTLGAAKYGMIMISIMICTLIYRRKNGKVSINYASYLTGTAVFIMELADWLMSVEADKLFGTGVIYENYYRLFIIVMLSLVAGSGTMVFGMAMAGYTGQMLEGKNEVNYLTRQINEAITNNNTNIAKVATGFKNLSYKILDMPQADSDDVMEFNIEKMANHITGYVCTGCVNSGVCWGSKAEQSRENVVEMINIAKQNGEIKKEKMPQKMASQCINQMELISGVNHLFERARLNFIWRTRLEEGRQAVAVQLSEMADIVGNFARAGYAPVKYDIELEERIKRKLREKRIIAKKIAITEDGRGITQVEITMKNKGKKKIDIEAVEEIISSRLGMKVKEVKHTDTALKLVEETNFDILYGISKRTKDTEIVSGDNHAITKIGRGQCLLSVCDGMGSGKKAHRYSEIVLDLLEQLLKNGFAQETSLKLINSVLMLGNQWDSPLAVDLGLVDLYSGTCNFVKMGAACTYIKRGNWVECLKSATLPIGITKQMEMENCTKKLYNGDFIIMISDGIIESLDGADKEEKMGRIIMDIDTNNPQKMSNMILQKAVEASGTEYLDDMTVLVAGVWDKV